MVWQAGSQARGMHRVWGLLLALALVLLIRHWICSPVLVVGTSMHPTLKNGQLVFVSKLAYSVRPPRRGDVVLIQTERELWIKRIVGLPGEQIAFQSGLLYINDRPVAEPYTGLKYPVEIAPGELPVDHYVVAGDNRAEFGLIAVVNRHRIVGRVVSL